ncbi:PI-PLC X domain-containing protein 3-like [Ruditapes philippinarum]|uniref:PI-PLC X domain-containing protein 3-like n=1 Tax=Ruditapes philippinarum TaxID=129788 RepID=UPI00295C314B|nr:PI-PLC X domain-containing protein 3-like [Ruditapes philippinarum]
MEKKLKAGPDWMSKLPPVLWDHPLNSLAIPGSHHSFSFYTDKEARIDRPSDPIYRQFVEEFGELAGEISYRWTVTQTTTFTQQLNLGIRYFDIRVTARGEEKEDKNVYLRNGPNVLQALKEFKVWIGMHPQEVIIIDFRVVNKMSPLHHKYLLANITQDLFEEKLLPYTGNVKGITLRNMWSLAKQIIVIYPKECTYGYSSVWPNDCTEYVITESQSAKDLFEKLESKYQHGRSPHMFLCQNGVMTPTRTYLDTHFHGTLKHKLSMPATKTILYWAMDKDISFGDVNIIVADFVESSDFCNKVVSINTEIKPRPKNHSFEPESRACILL